MAKEAAASFLTLRSRIVYNLSRECCTEPTIPMPLLALLNECRSWVARMAIKCPVAV